MTIATHPPCITSPSCIAQLVAKLNAAPAWKLHGHVVDWSTGRIILRPLPRA